MRRYFRVEKAQGYLFYADKLRTKRPEPFLEQDYVRNRFRHYVRLAGLDEVYDTSDETNPNRSVRHLHRLTTHSLRHFACGYVGHCGAGIAMPNEPACKHQITVCLLGKAGYRIVS